MPRRFEEHEFGAGDALRKDARVFLRDKRIVFTCNHEGWALNLWKTIIETETMIPQPRAIESQV